MTPLTSSNLVAAGYEASSQILRIQFKNATYDYFGVPEFIFQNLLTADSHGKYHAAHIKNSYHYQRV